LLQAVQLSWTAFSFFRVKNWAVIVICQKRCNNEHTINKMSCQFDLRFSAFHKVLGYGEVKEVL
jgi:hypothetical protein